MEGAMHYYRHKIPTRPQYEPQKWEIPDYGSKTQWADNGSNKPILTPKDRKYIQKLVGNFSIVQEQLIPPL